MGSPEGRLRDSHSPSAGHMLPCACSEAPVLTCTRPPCIGGSQAALGKSCSEHCPLERWEDRSRGSPAVRSSHAAPWPPAGRCQRHTWTSAQPRLDTRLFQGIGWRSTPDLHPEFMSSSQGTSRGTEGAGGPGKVQDSSRSPTPILGPASLVGSLGRPQAKREACCPSHSRVILKLSSLWYSVSGSFWSLGHVLGNSITAKALHRCPGTG